MPVGLLFINEGNRTAILHGGVCAAQLNARLPPTEVALAAHTWLTSTKRFTNLNLDTLFEARVKGQGKKGRSKKILRI